MYQCVFFLGGCYMRCTCLWLWSGLVSIMERSRSLKNFVLNLEDVWMDRTDLVGWRNKLLPDTGMHHLAETGLLACPSARSRTKCAPTSFVRLLSTYRVRRSQSAGEPEDNTTTTIQTYCTHTPKNKFPVNTRPRSIVIFRDPRDVVLSAYKMRTEKLHHAWVLELSLEEYIRTEFEVRDKETWKNSDYFHKQKKRGVSIVHYY